MAAKGQRWLTFVDAAKARGKRQGQIAEVMTLHNPILQDIPYTEMNEGTIHKESHRTSLPKVYYRKVNQGIPASKSEIGENTFTAAHFESKSQMDLKAASRGGKDRIPFNRWNQAKGHMIAMAHEHASLLFYGSPENDHRKTPGLADIFGSLDPADGEVYKQIIDCKGRSSNCTSMYLIAWGENGFFGIYPNDTSAGLKRTDHGICKIQSVDEFGAASEFWGYEESFELDHGVVPKDYRQGVRAANIDVDALIAGTGTDLIKTMIDMQIAINSLTAGKLAYYVNRTVWGQLRHQARVEVKAGGGLTYSNYTGQWVLYFDGIPVRQCDSLLSTETYLPPAA